MSTPRGPSPSTASVTNAAPTSSKAAPNTSSVMFAVTPRTLLSAPTRPSAAVAVTPSGESRAMAATACRDAFAEDVVRAAPVATPEATAAASTRAFSASSFPTTLVMASTSCVVCLASIVSPARRPVWVHY